MKPSGRRHTLKPGDVVCAERGDRLETLLGSCVAVVLTDPLRTLGAMCHIVHTSHATRSKPRTGADGEMAFDMMFKLLRARGIDPQQCLAYVYGGGNMFPSLRVDLDVGERNAQWVLETLGRYGIAVLTQDLGCFAYRRLSWTVGPDAPSVVTVPLTDDRFA